MEIASFPEVNLTLTRPESMTDEECASLPVFTDGEVVVSCWRPSADDLERLVRGEPIWLVIWSGRTHPPVAVTTERPFGAPSDG